MITRSKPRVVTSEENNLVDLIFTKDKPYFRFQVIHDEENPTFENCYIKIAVERPYEENWFFIFKVPAKNFLNDLLTSYSYTSKSLKVCELKRENLFTLHLRVDGELFVAEGFHRAANEIRKFLIYKYGYWKLQFTRSLDFI